MQEQGYHIFNNNNQGCFLYDEGEIYEDGIGRLHYTDFETMNSVFFCPKPNCPHTDNEICSSYGMGNFAVAIDSRLYYLNPNTHYDRKGNLVEEIEVYSADIDGTGRAKEGVIEDQDHIGYAIYGDGRLYFHYPKKLDNGKSESYIRCYDYESKSVSEYGPILEEYDVSEMFCGEYNGELYIMLFYRTEKLDRSEDTEITDEYLDYLNSISRITYKKLNIATGEFSEWTIPEKIKSANNMDVYALVKDGYFIYSDSKDTLAVTPDGEEYFFDEFDACNISMLNGMVMPYLVSGENKAIDLESGELVTLKLKEEGIKRGAYACGYHNGKYVLRCYDDVKWYDYKKVDLEVIR